MNVLKCLFRRLAAGLLAICLLVVLAGCNTPEPAQPVTEATQATTQATEAPTEVQSEPLEIVPPVTVSGEDLEGVWIAAAEPIRSEDENYVQITQAGYYEFDGTNFTYTQFTMAQRGTWAPLEDQVICRGTYTLDGDMLILHYTEEAGQAVDYTEQVSMLIDRSCADMCVRTPDHPKLGTLMFFRKARSGDPINSISVLLNGSL